MEYSDENLVKLFDVFVKLELDVDVKQIPPKLLAPLGELIFRRLRALEKAQTDSI